LGFYSAITLLVWRSFNADNRDGSLRAISLFALVGSLPTLFLVYVQAVIVHAWCPFCLASAAILFAILIVSFLDRTRRASLKPFVGSIPAVPDMIPAALALVLPSLAFVPLQEGVNRAVLDAKTPPFEVVAQIGKRSIALAEMDVGIRLRLQNTKDEYRSEWLDRQVLETEAKSRGIKLGELVNQEVYSKIQTSQREVDRRWEEIKSRLPANTTKASMEGNIRNELGQRKSGLLLKAYVEKLREKYGTEFLPPASEEVFTDANPHDGPELGSPNAPVTVVAFSDLECSYCARAHIAMEALVRRRPEHVRVVFRHFPLEHIHKNSRHAAEVAASVHEQGLFWKLADVLFRKQKTLDPDSVRKLAKEAGVDLGRMDSGLAEGKRIVAADIEAGKALGITATPSFFINGHYVGSLPAGDGLDKLVDRALKAAGR
jgi:glutaredoxin